MRSLKKNAESLCETLSVDLIVADWDGTLRPGFMLKDWLDYLASVKVIEDKYPHIFDSELHKYKNNQKSYDEFAVAVLDLYAESMVGYEEKKIAAFAARFVRKDKGNLFDFVMPLIKRAKQKNVDFVVVSGAPGIVLREYADVLGIKRIFGVEVATDASGVFKNQFVSNMAGPVAKREVVEQLQAQGHRLTISLGDTISDAPLLEAARFPFVISNESRAKTSRLLREIAPIIAPSELMEELESIL